MQIEDIKNNLKALKEYLAALAETRKRIPKLEAKREKTEKQLATMDKIDPLADDSADLIQRKAALEKQILLIDEGIASGGTGFGPNESKIVEIIRELRNVYGACWAGVEAELLGELRKLAESEEMKALFMKEPVSDELLRTLPAFQTRIEQRRQYVRFVDEFLYPEFKNNVEAITVSINAFIREVESYISTGKFEKFLA